MKRNLGLAALCAALSLAVLPALSEVTPPPTAPAPHAPQPPAAPNPYHPAHESQFTNFAMLPPGLLAAAGRLTPDHAMKVDSISTKLHADLKNTAGADRGKLIQQANLDIAAALNPEEQANLKDALPIYNGITQFRLVPNNVIGQLNLTPEQIQKLKPLFASVQEKRRALDLERRQKEQEMMKEIGSQAADVLTPEQKALAVSRHTKPAPKSPVAIPK